MSSPSNKIVHPVVGTTKELMDHLNLVQGQARTSNRDVLDLDLLGKELGPYFGLWNEAAESWVMALNSVCSRVDCTPEAWIVLDDFGAFMQLSADNIYQKLVGEFIRLCKYFIGEQKTKEWFLTPAIAARRLHKIVRPNKNGNRKPLLQATLALLFKIYETLDPANVNNLPQCLQDAYNVEVASSDLWSKPLVI